MHRYLAWFMVVLAFTGIGCPPAPPPQAVTPKKNTTTVGDTLSPPADLPDQLKDRIEAALEHVRSRELSTNNAFWTVFHGILGTGPEKTTLTNVATGKKVNAIEYICDGGEIRGMHFVPSKDGLDVESASPMNGLEGVAQGHQDQFIAEMAQWGMPRGRPFLVGGIKYTFEDFTRYSKARASVKQLHKTTKQKQELSWAIVIIAQYYGTRAAWTNLLGESLTYDDVVRHELDEPIETAACGGTDRLFGLTWAYHLHLNNGGAKEGVWKDVEAKLHAYKARAKELQNKDGSFSTDYFKGPGKKQDPQTRIGTTGHTVEWLSLVMTDEELRSPWMVDAVNALVVMILNMREEGIESGALYHAAHGLHLYHERVFGTPPAFLPLRPKK